MFGNKKYYGIQIQEKCREIRIERDWQLFIIKIYLTIDDKYTFVIMEANNDNKNTKLIYISHETFIMSEETEKTAFNIVNHLVFNSKNKGKGITQKGTII